MSNHGTAFGANLEHIWIVAKEDIPPVAAVFKDATAKLQDTRNRVDAAMKRPDHFTDPSPSVHDAWVSLHDAIAKIMSDTDRNLEDTARALSDAALRYANDDDAARKEFNRLCRQDGDPLPPGA